MVDACRRASGRARSPACIPYYGYARADRQKPLAANRSTAKIGWPICFGDLGVDRCGHGPAFLPDPGAISIFPVITSTESRCWWIISPPVKSGRCAVVPLMSWRRQSPGLRKRMHDAHLAIIDKRNAPVTNVARSLTVIGDSGWQNRNFDRRHDRHRRPNRPGGPVVAGTGGPQGAACATHPVFSRRPFQASLRTGLVEEVLVTNSIPDCPRVQLPPAPGLCRWPRCWEANSGASMRK